MHGCFFHRVVGACDARTLSEFAQNFGFARFLKKHKKFAKLYNGEQTYDTGINAGKINAKTHRNHFDDGF